MNVDLQNKHNRLLEIIAALEKVCIAFSGGVDSTLLLTICRETLGRKQALAITAVSETYTASEREMAEETARRLDAWHIFLPTHELLNTDFTDNDTDRCYHCKKSLFKELFYVAYAHGFATICDGSNTDDLDDYRPGRRAAAEHGVRSPLIEAGMNKEDVRALSRELGIPGWDRPANPCLASRIPYGTAITPDQLSAVVQSEEIIRSLGFRTVRVRHHGKTARIEVPPIDITRLMDPVMRTTVADCLKNLGFTWVCVDIEGYRMGSMNEIMSKAGRHLTEA